MNFKDRLEKYYIEGNALSDLGLMYLDKIADVALDQSATYLSVVILKKDGIIVARRAPWTEGEYSEYFISSDKLSLTPNELRQDILNDIHAGALVENSLKDRLKEEARLDKEAYDRQKYEELKERFEK